MIEDGAATFVCEGEQAPALIGNMTGWTPVEAGPRRLRFAPTGPGLWTLTLGPEPDAYLEHALLVDGERRLDPLNPPLAGPSGPSPP